MPFSRVFRPYRLALYRFFAEGAFNAAFVPMFSKRLEADENPEAFASLALSGLSLVLLTLTALAMIFMPALVYATAEGFYGDARFDARTLLGGADRRWPRAAGIGARFS